MGCCESCGYEEIPVMKTHASCNRGFRICDSARIYKERKNKFNNLVNDLFIQMDEDGMDSASVTSMSCMSSISPLTGIEFELNTMIIIEYVVNLNESELLNGWNSIDKKFKDKISIRNDFSKLLSYFIAQYVTHRAHKIALPNVMIEEYSSKVGKIISELRDLWQSILMSNCVNNYNINANTEYVTKQWFIENFQQYMEQIN
eukprot:UN00255